MKPLRKTACRFLLSLLPVLGICLAVRAAAAPEPAGAPPVDALDTVIFDLSQATCQGSYAQFPVYIQSDDIVYALDFSFRFNLNKMVFSNVTLQVPFLMSSANYNGTDSTLRFTSFSMQPVPHNVAVVYVRFSLPAGGQIDSIDLYSIKAWLNGDVCSHKVIGGPPAPVLSPGVSASLEPGDSLLLSVTAPAGSAFLWSTGETTQDIMVDTTGTYSVTVSTQAGCAIPLSITVIQAVPLPVSLVRFGLTYAEGQVLATWETASEVNNDYFTLERVEPDAGWTPLAIVPGAGTSSVPHRYAAADDTPRPGWNRYRLKQTDFDGGEHTTEPAAVWAAPAGGPVVEVLDGTAPGSLALYAREHAEAVLLDPRTAQVVARTTFDAGSHTWPLPYLAAGVYLLRATGRSQTAVQKVLVLTR